MQTVKKTNANYGSKRNPKNQTLQFQSRTNKLNIEQIN